MSAGDVTASLPVMTGLERDMMRISRARLVLHNQLVERPAWLRDVFADRSLPHACLRPAGDFMEFRWRLVVVGRTEPLLQLALSDALLESLGLAAPSRAGVLLA